MAYTFALDCSLGGLHMAMAATGFCQPLFVYASNQPRAADALHAVLAEQLALHNLALREVDTFVTTVGPGSFTGIRMGLAVGQALKLANPRLALVGLGTLEVLAANLVATTPLATPFRVATDAAGASLYMQDFQADGTPLAMPRCQPVNEVAVDASVYAPATLLLDGSTVLPPLAPATLLALALNPACHQPFQPLYIKPLAYKTSA